MDVEEFNRWILMARRTLESARRVAEEVRGTAFLVGSYVRGDFSVDSDVDVVVIGNFSGPPHRRLLDLDTPPGVEILAFNINEILHIVGRCYPLALDIAIGVVLKDELGIADELVARARRCLGITH